MNAAARAWLTVGLLWVAALLNYLDRLMIAALREPLVAEVAMSDAQFGLLTSVFLWTYGLASPLGGFLADRFSRRATIAASLLAWSAVTWATAHAHSLGALVAARVLLGLSEACYIPAALALIADFHPGPTRSLATGIHMSGIYAGVALSGAGGAIAEAWGWRAGFQWFGLAGIGYAVVCGWLLRDAAPGGRGPAGGGEAGAGRLALRAALAELLGRRAFLGLLAANAIVGLANWAIYGWLPTYLKEQFKLGLGAAGLTATGYIQAASFAGVLLGGAWADRWSRTQPRARALVPAAGFAVAAPCLFFGIGATGLAVAVASLVVFGMARGFFDANLMPIVRLVTGRRTSATAYGLLNFIGVTTGGAMIYAGGWLRDADASLAGVFRFAAAALLVVGAILFAIRPGLSDETADRS